MYSIEDMIRAYQAYVQNQPQQPSSAAQSSALDALQKPPQQTPAQNGQTGGYNGFTPQGFYSAPNAQGGMSLSGLMGGGAGAGAGAGTGAAEGAGAAGGLGV